MTRYRLSPEAEGDLDEIKHFLVRQGGARLARYVQHEIRDAIRFLAANPGAGHKREDLTDEPMKFWSVFSYMIAYYPAANLSTLPACSTRAKIWQTFEAAPATGLRMFIRRRR